MMRIFVCLLAFSLCSSICGQWNLYEKAGNQSLAFDCLDYYVDEEDFRGPRFEKAIYQKIPYCRRPLEHTNDVFNDSNVTAEKFSFDLLRRLNITVYQLMTWSATVDLAEDYSIYLSQSSIDHIFSSRVFYNCTRPWFGSRCQYSFDLGSDMSLSDVVQITFEEKGNIKHPRHSLTNLTCYQFMKCNRGLPMCLDWREVCNGRIDCIDGGEDEAYCWALEINECAEDEYRCHNGMCIPLDFLHDDRYNPDCLDRTDEISAFNTFDSCSKDPTFRCEEHSCHPNFGLFPVEMDNVNHPFIDVEIIEINY